MLYIIDFTVFIQYLIFSQINYLGFPFFIGKMGLTSRDWDFGMKKYIGIIGNSSTFLGIEIFYNISARNRDQYQFLPLQDAPVLRFLVFFKVHTVR